MKTHIPSAALLVVMCALFAPNSADATTFLYSGVIESYLIPISGIYSLTVAGAQGGAAENPDTFGGGGALIAGHLYLTNGTVLSILAGGAGSQMNGDGGSGGSGGGMSFLADGSTPLIVAGGGGGSYWFFGGRGGPGQIGTSGQSTAASAGGNNGQGGQGGGAGAGILSDGDGGADANIFFGGGGHSGPTFVGGAGYLGNYSDNGPLVPGPGADGGFGGGGGGGYSCGGGGGGYSGGGGNGCAQNGGGGGGGSYIAPTVTNVTATAGGNSAPIIYDNGFDFSDGNNNGYVDINFISSVPEPAQWIILMLGFGATGLAIRRRGKLYKRTVTIKPRRHLF